MNSHCASCHTGHKLLSHFHAMFERRSLHAPHSSWEEKIGFLVNVLRAGLARGVRGSPCAAGYQGSKCNVPIKSCHGYNDGERAPGVHTLLDDSFYRYQVR